MQVSRRDVLAFAFVFTVQQTSMPTAGIKPAIPANDRPHILALNRSATGISGIEPIPLQ
jgi:hypothetical protein